MITVPALRTEANPSATSPEGQPVAGKILVVDDVPENVDLLSLALELAGHTVLGTCNAPEALDLAVREKPDLILLDIVMPEIDGYEICRRLKTNPVTREILVIFLTGQNHMEAVVKGFEVGAVDYVSKPFHNRELLIRVNTHLELRRARIQAEVMAHKMEGFARKASKYVSPEVHAAIFSGKADARIGTKRRHLTVFFSDIVDFTSLTEVMGDRELTRWLNQYFDQMAQIAHRNGGTLDKFIGDAVMVFFGDPRTAGPEEDARACVRMALEMVESARKRDVAIRVGINSGECSVGNFGSEAQMNYTAIGSTVNVAARLQSHSLPHNIIVSDATRRLVEEEFACQDAGPVPIHGIRRPIGTHWIC